ncbi:MAG: SDR family oxidoreductase [Clostridia bacterium]|nr:SDR family oxidoreductase [Clostridia bacterium]
MENSIKGKKAIITGASGGIGENIAKSLAAEGVKLVLLGRNKEKLDNLACEIEKISGEKPVIIPGDITSAEYVKNAVKTASEALDGIDIVINNAGVAHSTPFEEISEEQYDTIMDTNVKGPFLMCREVLPVLKKSDGATIINIASVTAHKGYPLQSIYVASKHALLGFSKSLAKEVFEDGIRVHVLSPGGVFTDMIKTSRPDLTSDGMIVPEDISDIILFLLKHRGNAVIDEIGVHRAAKEPFM